MNGVVKTVVNLLRRLGPYAAIELLLPGGSLLALLLWLYRARVAHGTLFALCSGSAPAQISSHICNLQVPERGKHQLELCMKSANMLMTGTCC
jgi:hypothetical protein